MQYFLFPFKALCAWVVVFGIVAVCATWNISPVIVMVLVAAAGFLYYVLRFSPFAAVCVLLSALMCVLLFRYIPRQVDALYYEHLLKFEYSGVADLILSSYKDNILGSEDGTFARGSFLLLMQPLLNQAAGYSGMGYVPANFAVMFAISTVIHELSADFYKNHNLDPSSIAIGMVSAAAGIFLISPSTIYFSADLMKDLIALLFSLLSALLFVRKNYFTLVISLIISIAVRRYNPLASFCVIMAVRPPGKWDYAIFASYAVLLLLIVRLNISAIANMILSIFYIYVNPLPFRVENWNFPTSLLTVQGLINVMAMLAAFVQIARRPMRKLGLDRISIAIAMFGFLVIAVGYNNMVNLRGEAMQIGRGGDNMTRKALPALPLIAMQLAFTWSTLLAIIGKRRGTVVLSDYKNLQGVESEPHR